MATQASASKWRKASRRITETLVLFQIMVAIRKPTSFQASAVPQNLNSHHDSIAAQPKLHLPGCSAPLFPCSSSPARLCSSVRPRPSTPADLWQLPFPRYFARSTFLIRFRPVTHFHFARRAVPGLKSRTRIWLGPRVSAARHGLLTSLLHGTELWI
jgi:hypothetical protein